MGETKNQAPMKEQEESPEKELNKMQASNLSETEYKVMVLRMLSRGCMWDWAGLQRLSSGCPFDLLGLFRVRGSSGLGHE